MDSFEAGKTFRLKNDPGRKGILTGKDALFAGLRRLQVRFFDGSTEWVPEDQLEVVEESDDDPLSLLEKGRLSRSQDLRRTLLHARLSGRLTNVIYSMDTAGADFYAYQFKPLVKLLNSANRGILIADEVGLGKTIEAGLIWTELRFRFDYRRLLVVCPSMLRGKWERELRRRFGLKPENADASRLLALLQQAEDDPDATRFAAIASLQGIRPPRDWGELEETTGAAPTLRLARFLEEKEEQRPLIDLVVIDEAHSMRNPDTASAAAGRLFRGVTEHLVLLSATPVHLRSADLFQLVNLVDPDTFARAEEFDYLLSANAPLVRARDLAATGRADSTQVRRELESAAAHPLLRQSEQIAALLQSLPTDGIVREPAVVVDLVWRIENVNLLGHAITRTRKRDVKEWQVLREAVAEAIEPSALEGEFYGTVTRTVREYCARAGSHSGFLLVSPQRQMTSSMAAALRAWSDAVSDDPDLAYQDIGMVEPDDDDSLRPLRAELLRKACTFGSYQALRSSDSKYDRLRTLLTAYFGEHPGEKVVLFAFFKQTLFYLAERLREDGVRTALLHGDTEDKDGAIEAFRNAPGGTVLLSSEVGSEGVDLQFCHVLVNYDMPWNPMKVEQRIGRLDRLGQEAPKVIIWNLFYRNTIDARIYERLYKRLRIFEESVGSLEPILGDSIRRLTLELLSENLSPEEELRRIDQTTLALENERQDEERLEQEAAHLVAYGDYILEQVSEAREKHRRIDAHDLMHHVTGYMKGRYPGCDFVQRSDSLDFEITLSMEARHDLERFLREQHLEGTTRLADLAASRVPCRFENKLVTERRGRVEAINQAHPLVRFVSAKLDDPDKRTRPAVAIRLSRLNAPASCRPGTHVFTVQRWSMKGIQSLEYLHFEAARLDPPHEPLPAADAERLIMAASTGGQDWLEAATEVDGVIASQIVRDSCIPASEAALASRVKEMRSANEDRYLIQRQTVERHLNVQRTRLREIAARHRLAGRKGLESATEKKVEILQDRVTRRLREIEERRAFSHRKEDLCTGVLRIDAD